MPRRLWVELYRPTTIENYLFQNDSHKERFLEFIKQKSIPHLLFSGHRGTGKTTLALILKNELGIADGDFKILNASDDNSVEVVRNNIKNFVQTLPLGDFKIVFLDESDWLSASAQAALRRMMEEYSDTARFILTCNKPHKIIPEIKSRCQEFIFKEFDKQEMAVHAYTILKKEGVKVTNAALLQEYVSEAYPDMRKLLQNLESNVIDGVLQDPITADDKGGMFIQIIEQLNKGKWLETRDYLVKDIEDNEWDEIYKFLYDNLDQIKGFDNQKNWRTGIILIADHLRFHAQVADPEINFTACMLRLAGVIEK